MTFFTADRRRVNVYPGQGPDSRSTFSHAVSSVCKNLLALGCPDFSLAAISVSAPATNAPRQASAGYSTTKPIRR